MQKKFWIICSIFAVLLWVTKLVSMLCYTQGLKMTTYEASRPLWFADQVSEVGYDILFKVFLLVIGWFLVYGFAKLRFILPVSLAILLVSALIEFAFTPWSRAPWFFEGQRAFHAVFWCGVIQLTSWAVQKYEEILQRKNIMISVFSVVGLLLFINSVAIQIISFRSVKIFLGSNMKTKLPLILLQNYHLLYLVLLFLAGWYTVYGFLHLRIVFCVTIGILLFPAMTTFVFNPEFGPGSIFDGVLFAAGWVGIMGLYRFVFQKVSHSIISN